MNWLLVAVLLTVWVIETLALLLLIIWRLKIRSRLGAAWRASVVQLADEMERAQPRTMFVGEGEPDEHEKELIQSVAQQVWTLCCRAVRSAATPDLVVPDDLSREKAA